jgi:hypothetical protein
VHGYGQARLRALVSSGGHGTDALRYDLAAELPLPDTGRWIIRWPISYAWEHAHKRLNPIRAALTRLVKVEPCEFTSAWRAYGGFPLDAEDLDRCGKAGEPRNAHDLRGEVFIVTTPKAQLICALDFSDYPLVSSQIRDNSDLYFKFCCPQDHHERVW